MPQYKLMYFDVRARAEVARMLFALKGVDFEDYRFKDGEFAKIKGDQSLFPLGQAPVLLVDGKPYPQSKAIAQYLAREFDLYGANNEEATQIDIIAETVADLFTKIIKFFFNKDEEEKKKGLEDFRDNGSKAAVAFLERTIGDKKFCVGNTETLADCNLHHGLCILCSVLGEEYMDKNYPGLMKYYKGITENSKLTQYLKNRPVNSI